MKKNKKNIFNLLVWMFDINAFCHKCLLPSNIACLALILLHKLCRHWTWYFTYLFTKRNMIFWFSNKILLRNRVTFPRTLGKDFTFWMRKESGKRFLVWYTPNSSISLSHILHLHFWSATFPKFLSVWLELTFWNQKLVIYHHFKL